MANGSNNDLWRGERESVCVRVSESALKRVAARDWRGSGRLKKKNTEDGTVSESFHIGTSTYMP